MGFFTNTVAARLAGRTVQMAELLFLDFVGDPMRLWLGAGDLVTTDGNTWAGLDGIGSIEGIQYAIGSVAPKATLRISALDPSILTLAQQQSALVKNRAATLYLQFFDANWQPLDAPFAYWTGFMDTMAYQGTRDGIYSVSVSVEGAWTGRNRSATVSWRYGSTASGGAAAWFGVWNVYDRRPVFTSVIDNATTWATTSGSFEPLHASGPGAGLNNRITFVQGLAEDSVLAELSIVGTGTTAICYIGLGLDSPTTAIANSFVSSGGSSLARAEYAGYPGIGLHYFQAEQASGLGGTSVSYIGGGGFLRAQLRM